MPIESTLGRVVNAEPALRRMADHPLPVRAAYLVVKLAKAVAVEADIYHQRRHAIFKAHGTERPSQTDAERAQYGPTVIELAEAARAPVAALLAELHDIPVTLAASPLTLTQLDGVSLSPIDLLALEPLLAADEP